MMSLEDKRCQCLLSHGEDLSTEKFFTSLTNFFPNGMIDYILKIVLSL